ncbi:hypothetical protein [Archaeoglobus veneficus]|uniref:Uncharacterized protein n=1 Tax=Archaeoglobus veneficus (strain DSM 11195 / SNP6) TaxID=693661 RepID=F2KS10_ARCVS|nr:hypothetical protein [Archaeoglobus veneficus]AEA46851.1 hypothetical protein Arcve_0836 [Archaeoglobus veneficus SNP6]
MLAPVRIKGQRYWIEFSIRGELWTPIPDITELRKLVLKEICINDVYEDWEIAYDVKRTAAMLLKRGLSPKQVVQEMVELYGIPEPHVFEVLEGLVLQIQ